MDISFLNIANKLTTNLSSSSYPWLFIVSIVITMVILLFLSSFFSSAETAYASLNIAKLNQDVKSKKKSALLIQKQIKSFSKTLTSILVGNNLVNIGFSSMTTLLLSKTLQENEFLITIFTIFLATPLVIIFGEIIPKILAKKYAYQFLKKTCYIVEFFNYLFIIITFPVLYFKKTNENVTNSEMDLKSYVEIANEEGVINKDESKLISNAFDLNSEKVIRHYVKSENITFLNADDNVAKAIELTKKDRYSRIPVKQQNNFLGIIHISDLLGEEPETNIRKYIYQIPKISHFSSLTKALESLRSEKKHMAFVTKKNLESQQEQIIGIITMEDIIEELVGEIYDEYDDDVLILEVSLGKYHVWGNAKMSNFISQSEIDLEADEDENVSDWIKKRFKKKIKLNSKFIYKKQLQIKVIEINKKKVFKYEIILK
ncbi:HEMOLYSIN C [Mycoplasmopsis pulmonis]|uniref:HEMOLYSIN C n=1 Tax=Mycoplasmopsis pulmonis (strain UAB CTIP) TaxID=272635 RepID=Q98Q54_MYCPU|nr:hemolysin family protein [Mycoplasmopsis pulmonis]MDZ7293476.1 hemolysin family protein [Mycoplasmopsis pulmonis]CAC13687.1 HEMOLYSIN C [Mycoplasmopsis pulmonis]VEU68282.1 Putative Mg2+ and Co2+ transporter CorB [Mycoplasmopsis pulmonis]